MPPTPAHFQEHTSRGLELLTAAYAKEPPIGLTSLITESEKELLTESGFPIVTE